MTECYECKKTSDANPDALRDKGWCFAYRSYCDFIAEVMRANGIDDDPIFCSEACREAFLNKLVTIEGDCAEHDTKDRSILIGVIRAINGNGPFELSFESDDPIFKTTDQNGPDFICDITSVSGLDQLINHRVKISCRIGTSASFIYWPKVLEDFGVEQDRFGKRA